MSQASLSPKIKYSAPPPLLPSPKRVRRAGGIFRIPEAPRIFLENAQRPLLLAASALADALHVAGARASMDLGADSPRIRPGDILLHHDGRQGREAYRLSIGPRHVLLEGGDTAGLFYGLQTLIQLVRAYGTHLPRMNIEDEPAFPYRGYSLDISRGKVPTLATLQRLADRLAALKVNELQLYVEHVFDFRFDPDIPERTGYLTPGEILQLDAYCRDRCMELVPSLACFGHMGRILSLPAYRALAEVEWPAPDWEHASWRQRLRGATLNPRDPRSRQLLRQMTDEFLPLFSASRFNACCDETYDLGKGRNAAFARRRGIAALYLDHLRFLRALAGRHGKRLMFWGDVMLQHPRAISRIPKDCIVLDWGYSALTPFYKVDQFIRHGLDAYVCPSVRGYQVVFHQVEVARANIAGYAEAGARLGAKGLLTTDWGDMGHFNLLACSLHGMALGAALGWNPSTDPRDGFDRAFSWQVFGDPHGDAARLFRRLGSTPVASWPLFLAKMTTPPGDLPPAWVARSVLPVVCAAPGRWEAFTPSAWISPHDLHELALASRALELNAEKILLYLALPQSGRHPDAALRRRLRAFSDALRDFNDDYARVWLAANKPSGLEELRRALLHVARTARRAAGGTERAPKDRP